MNAENPTTPIHSQNDTSADDGPVTEQKQPERRSWMRRPLVVGAGIAVGAVLLVGGGVALGAAVADDFDEVKDGLSEPSDRVSGTASGSDQEVGRSADDGDTDRANDATAASVSPRSGATSAAELSAVIAAAARVADGAAVSIEAEPDSAWDVTFQTDAGESEVRVSADGSAALISTAPSDADDRPAVGVLDTKTVDALIAAALAHTDGRILDVEVDDDAASPYDASVLTPDGSIVDIALDGSMVVLAADMDD